MSSESQSRVLYENLDTSFVNLWNLLRHLSQRDFVGRVHVEMEDYEADVFLTGSNTPLVHEIDRAAGTDVLEEAAMHRLVLRARESSGTISVFEGADEAVAVTKSTLETKAEPAVKRSVETPLARDDSAIPTPTVDSTKSQASETVVRSPVTEDKDSTGEEDEVVRVGGELIGAVERGLIGAGADFATLFKSVRIELADDYPFLDPISGFDYTNSAVSTHDEIPPAAFVTGVSEALHRAIDKAAQGERARRIRERVALDLAVTARKHKDALERSGFSAQLDRIAGTKVI
jgi:hypothetical protein